MLLEKYVLSVVVQIKLLCNVRMLFLLPLVNLYLPMLIRTLVVFPQMPFLHNPFYLYGNASMTPNALGKSNC